MQSLDNKRFAESHCTAIKTRFWRFLVECTIPLDFNEFLPVHYNISIMVQRYEFLLIRRAVSTSFYTLHKQIIHGKHTLDVVSIRTWRYSVRGNQSEVYCLLRLCFCLKSVNAILHLF